MAAPVNNLLAALSRHPELDRRAVLAVARQEGLGGGVGDQGTSFGPFQLHVGGAFPSGVTGNRQAWAWSPQGIEYALSRISSVAGGLKGAPAVQNIVSRFERPANPSGEISRALASYGGPVPTGGGAAGLVQPASAAAPGNDPRLLQILLATRQAVGLPAPSQGFQSGFQSRPTPQAPQTPASGNVTASRGLASVDGVQVNSGVAPLLAQLISRFHVTPTSGYRDPAHNAQVGGASNSDHLRGNAVDFGGTPQALAALYAYAQGRFPYVEPMAQAKDHVHISFSRP